MPRCEDLDVIIIIIATTTTLLVLEVAFRTYTDDSAPMV
jgi:hypothetical protein